VNHTTETVATLDTSLAPRRRRRHRSACRVGWIEGQRSVRPVAVVVSCEHVEDALKMLLVQDQQPVEARREHHLHRSSNTRWSPSGREISFRIGRPTDAPSFSGAISIST